MEACLEQHPVLSRASYDYARVYILNTIPLCCEYSSKTKWRETSVVKSDLVHRTNWQLVLCILTCPTFKSGRQTHSLQAGSPHVLQDIDVLVLPLHPLCHILLIHLVPGAYTDQAAGCAARYTCMLHVPHTPGSPRFCCQSNQAAGSAAHAAVTK